MKGSVFQQIIEVAILLWNSCATCYYVKLYLDISGEKMRYYNCSGTTTTKCILVEERKFTCAIGKPVTAASYVDDVIYYKSSAMEKNGTVTQNVGGGPVDAAQEAWSVTGLKMHEVRFNG